jgi:hypothetical protein
MPLVTQTVRASALPAPAPECAWLLHGPLSEASLPRRHRRARRPRSGAWRVARPPLPASSACSAGRPCLPRVRERVRGVFPASACSPASSSFVERKSGSRVFSRVGLGARGGYVVIWWINRGRQAEAVSPLLPSLRCAGFWVGRQACALRARPAWSPPSRAWTLLAAASALPLARSNIVLTP